MVDKGLIEVDLLENEGLLIEDEDGNKRLPVAVADWESHSPTYMAEVRDIVGGSAGDKSEDLAAYIEAFVQNHHLDENDF